MEATTSSSNACRDAVKSNEMRTSHGPGEVFSCLRCTYMTSLLYLYQTSFQRWAILTPELESEFPPPKFYQFGAEIGIGINFLPHVGIGVGIGIRMMDWNRNLFLKTLMFKKIWNRNRNRSQNSWNRNRNRSRVIISKWNQNRSRNQNARVEPESESEPGPSGTAHLCFLWCT